MFHHITLCCLDVQHNTYLAKHVVPNSILQICPFADMSGTTSWKACGSRNLSQESDRDPRRADDPHQTRESYLCICVFVYLYICMCICVFATSWKAASSRNLVARVRSGSEEGRRPAPNLGELSGPIADCSQARPSCCSSKIGNTRK